MGNRAIETTVSAKGPILYWLDQFSRGAEARHRLARLSDAIKKLAPTYQGLEIAFDEHLAAPLHPDTAFRQRLVEHLRQHWFSDGPEAHFPAQLVTQKYAEAVIKTIELSLNGKPHPVPINAWWMIQRAEKDVKMVNLAEVDRNGVTTSSSVTLLICTPVPPPAGPPSARSLWGDAEGWVTEQQGHRVITRQLEKETRPER
jgi:hypothetical protein